MESHAQALREASEDLALVQRQLAAMSLLLSASAYAIADALEAQAKAKKQARCAARKAAKATPAKTA